MTSFLLELSRSSSPVGFPLSILASVGLSLSSYCACTFTVRPTNKMERETKD